MTPQEALQRYPLFALVPVTMVRHWLEKGQSQAFTTGETIFQESSPGTWAYLLLRGRVRVLRKTASGREVTLGNLKPGQLFGEYALLPPGLNTATCRAATEVRLWRFPLAPVRDWLAQTPAVASALKNWLMLHFLLCHLRGQAFLGFMSAPSALAMLPHLVTMDVGRMRTLQADGLCEDWWFFIEAGEVMLSAGEAPPRSLGPGATLGEEALVPGRELPVAVALTATRCLGLPRQFFIRPDQPVAKNEQSYAAVTLENPSRIRWVGQREEADCGAACLAMLAQYFELPFTLDEIRAQVQIGPRGLGAVELLHAARSLSMEGQAVRIHPNQLFHVHVPAIAHLDGGHYVVLYRLDMNGALLGDPASGLVTISMLHFAQRFSGCMLVLRASHAVAPHRSETGLLPQQTQ